MAVLDILTYPDERLRQASDRVQRFDVALQARIDDLEETRKAGPGAVGIAAPQVGWFERVIIVDVSGRKKTRSHGHLILVNPEITEWDGFAMGREGCLSVPGIYESVRRFQHVRVSSLDRDGNETEVEAFGLLAVCIQHEMDHLDGKLFVDYLSELKRQRIRKKMEKGRRDTATSRSGVSGTPSII